MSARLSLAPILVATLGLLLAMETAQAAVANVSPAGPIELTVIGYDIEHDSKEEKQLKDMAAAANGRYLSVTSGQPGLLTDAVMQGTGLSPPGALGAPGIGKGPEQEPNNRYSEATAVTPTAHIQATVQPRGDRDYFRIRVAHQGQLDVALTPVPASMALWIEVYDADYRRIAGPFYAARDGVENIVHADLPSAGEYWLHIGDRNDRGESAEVYGLQLGFRPSADEGEPNANRRDAAAIDPTMSVQANILPRGDRDWFVMEVPDQGQLELHISAAPEKLALWIEVYDADARRIAGPFYAARPGVENLASADLPKAGRYFLHIGDRNDAERAIEPYQLETRFTPSGDDVEPNGSFAQAKPLAPAGEIEATILPRGDRDWYRIAVEDQGRLEVHIPAPAEKLALWIEVYDANLSRIAGPFYAARRGVENFAVADLPSAGVYAVHIGDHNDAERSVSPYRLQTQFTPTGDRFEPNASFGSAKPIAANTTLQAAILPRGDRDWYRLQVDKAGRLRMDLTDVPEKLALWIEVYDADKRRIGGPFYAARAGADNRAEVSLPAAGRYAIHIGAAQDKESAPQPYTLTLELLGAP